MPQAPVRVLIASRSPARSAGVASFLSVPPLEPAVVLTVDAALALLDAAPHELVIIDRRLADAPGTELAGEVRRAHSAMPMLFAVDDGAPESQLEALAAGASGCPLPTWTREAVLDAARDALRGVAGFDLDALRPLADLARRTSPREVVLTEQERWCCA